MQTINTIHFDITEFCNYTCEYCFQRTHNVQKHISDALYDNFFIFLSNRKEQFNVHLIGGEPFLYPRFFEMAEKIIEMGHKISATTNFSLPKKILEKFLNIAKGKISFWEITIHLTQIKNLDDLYDRLTWFKEQSGLDYSDFQINCVLTEENFEEVIALREELKRYGFSLTVQRIFDKKDYCEYSQRVEEWLAIEKCIDIPLNIVRGEGFCNVSGKPCRTGNKFFKIHINGKVARCFTWQTEDSYGYLGDMSKTVEIKVLPDYTPCFSIDNRCRCYFGFKRLGQIDHRERDLLR